MVQIYCVICGAPISTDDDDGWLNKCTLFTSAHETENGFELDLYYPRTNPPRTIWSYHLGLHPPDEAQRRVLRLDADIDDDVRFRPYFKLVESGKEVRVMSVHLERNPLPPGKTQGGPIYLPIHGHCVHIADCFVHSVDRGLQIVPQEDHGNITSICQLWEVLYRRLDGYISANEYRILEPHDYFAGSSCRKLEWETDEDELEGELLESDPVEIPDLTKSILPNLELMPMDLPIGLVPNGQDKKFFQWANNLQNAEMTCDYTFHQDWWCGALISKRMFPWLWDIDIDMVRKRQQTGNWNWELLARQLSQVEIHIPQNTLLELPLQLRNRRRIWRILEEGRVDDIARLEGEKYRSSTSRTGSTPR